MFDFVLDAHEPSLASAGPEFAHSILWPGAICSQPDIECRDFSVRWEASSKPCSRIKDRSCDHLGQNCRSRRELSSWSCKSRWTALFSSSFEHAANAARTKDHGTFCLECFVSSICRGATSLFTTWTFASGLK